ncbi:alpha/beta hydrolase [Ramlibacter sp.]|uniref:alpha/beta hydrolase n=1 Tax=Ramlibacter sp. TaxID=1917967 RepID=UPI0017C281FB|nr:alpha/beta hydrolase [Ramlibacter sp.]MBA2675995.1 alpha/beta hydrolase [Ramlibacter sp.]
MRAVLRGMERKAHVPMHLLPPAEARAAYAAGADVLELPKATLARVQDLVITARDGAQLPARLYAPGLYAPDGRPLSVLLYFHGGGFTIGSIDTHDALCRELCRLAGCAVLSLGYRLAPEHRFPTAADDSWDALQWLAREGGAALGVDASRIAVGGDSAGGTLAAVCAIEARDAGIALRLQLLFYPGCAAWQLRASHQRYGQGLALEQAHIEYFFSNYIDDAQREDWRFAPLNAPDLEGVAPAWFGLAECDPLVDDCMAYVDTLRLAGVAVDLEIWRGVTHEFIKMGRVLPEARQAHAAAAAALREAFNQ